MTTLLFAGVEINSTKTDRAAFTSDLSVARVWPNKDQSLQTVERNWFQPGRSCSYLPSVSARKTSNRAFISRALAFGSRASQRVRISGFGSLFTPSSNASRANRPIFDKASSASSRSLNWSLPSCWTNSRDLERSLGGTARVFGSGGAAKTGQVRPVSKRDATKLRYMIDPGNRRGARTGRRVLVAARITRLDIISDRQLPVDHRLEKFYRFERQPNIG